VSALVHFYTSDLRALFHIIGSADRDLLQEVGITFGNEFCPAPEEEEFLEEEEEETEDSDWDIEEVEADAGREIVAKMIMSGLPQDLAEDEAYAVQDFMASYVIRGGQVHTIDPDDVLDETALQHESAQTAETCRRMLVAGAGVEELGKFVDHLQAAGASHELVARVQMLYLGRLPESDEPTFTDLEEDAYTARFGYLYSEEAASVADEVDELLPAPDSAVRPLAVVLSALFSYCNSQSADLLVTVEE
jgi:hypothetical protein